MTQQSVGLIGIGLLGTAIAERLLRAGFSVYAFDTSEPRRDDLTALGGTGCSSAAEVARQCRRLLLSLPNSVVVQQVLAELLPQLTSGSLVLDTTTGSATDAEQAGRQLGARGAFYLDATVAGSSEQMRLGQATLMVGGDSQAMAECRDIWDALAAPDNVFFLGPCGSGARMKLVVNLVLGLNRAVLAEGLTLARRVGIDLATALKVLRNGPAYSAAMDTKGPKMIAQDFEPQARLAQHHKDVELILELGQTHLTELPLSRVHEQLLRRAIGLGLGDQDNSAIIKALE